MNQETALTILKTGGNVFLTGEPGAGKTYVLNNYIAWLEACGVSVAVTASTGIAATHIGGMTIHAWSGIGARDTLTNYDLDQIATREVVVRRVKKASVLVIDEISMLDGKIIDMVNAVTRKIRASQEPFGGLQVVLVGDFFQLPPVTRNGDAMRYAYESRGWEEARLLVCYLGDQYRQEDEQLLGLLHSIRRNEVDEEHFTLLQEQTDITYEGVEPTKLYTHNADVDTVNAGKLSELKGQKSVFTMSSMGRKPVVEALVKTCLSPWSLELKIDAMVMCTKNNFEAGYVNGTLGRVVAFEGLEGYPVIETAEGNRVTIKPASWSMSEDKKVLAEITQLPLRLAWAITIHKSQGMSLDAVEIDLSKAFVFGQGYVALSRVRSLAGLKMLGMNPTALRIDPKIVKSDEKFRTLSVEAETAFDEMDESEVSLMHERFVGSCGGKLVKGKVEVKTKKFERVKKVSTYEETKELLLAGKGVKEIAKAREMTESTIWSHVEKLVEMKSISLTDIDHILVANDWSVVKDPLLKAIRKVGREKLKPIFEETGEKYDYNLIRLARIVHDLGQN
ncbi:AAA family ATPase [Candidatus Kaiserbacteria bacterium]|nr:AAA family ATPase [Candidatus Kaiserbacteria bacterium]